MDAEIENIKAEVDAVQHMMETIKQRIDRLLANRRRTTAIDRAEAQRRILTSSFDEMMRKFRILYPVDDVEVPWENTDNNDAKQWEIATSTTSLPPPPPRSPSPASLVQPSSSPPSPPPPPPPPPPAVPPRTRKRRPAKPPTPPADAVSVSAGQARIVMLTPARTPSRTLPSPPPQPDAITELTTLRRRQGSVQNLVSFWNSNPAAVIKG